MSRPVVVNDPSGAIFAGGYGRVVNGEYGDTLPKLYKRLEKLANDPAMEHVYFKGAGPELKKTEKPDEKKPGVNK